MPRSLEEIQKDLKNPALEPGSEAEQHLLEEGRAARALDTSELQIIKAGELEAAAAEHGVIRREAAQHAAHVAVEQVTGEHRVPVQIFDQERQ
jgi:hypothetical protein